MTSPQRKVLVTGGAGYVGAVLCPKLIREGYQVRVLDTCWYGDDVFPSISEDPSFELIIGDIRNEADVLSAVRGCTDVIHLACISNDPSYDLDTKFGEEINFLAFEPLVQRAKSAGVSRFIYASSSSVYGVKQEEEVTEDLKSEPLTDYSKFKAQCEDVLGAYASEAFTVTTIRPATICGYSPRQRLDLVVNILVNHAVNEGSIRVFGGSQYRPNLHIDDMCRAYLLLLAEPHARIHKKVFNVGGVNHTVSDLAELVRTNVDGDPKIVMEPTNDLRSYRISSKLIEETLNFRPEKTVGDAVRDLVEAFREGRLHDSMSSTKYYNIQRMAEILSNR